MLVCNMSGTTAFAAQTTTQAVQAQPQTTAAHNENSTSTSGTTMSAKEAEKKLKEQQAELENKEFSATAGGGVVEVTVTGKREVSKVKIDPEAVDPDDVEMLEDLIVAATNEALRKCEEESQAQMAKITGGLGGLGGGLF